MLCRLCDSSRFELWSKGVAVCGPDDFRVTDSQYGRTFTLKKCLDCSLVQAEAPEGTIGYYEAMSDQEYLASESERRYAASLFLDQLGVIAGKKLLDVGAGAGYLVEEAKLRGAFATGIDPCQQFVDSGRGLGRNLICGTLSEPLLQDQQFDIITIMDVLEHVESPSELVKNCEGLLNKDGILMIVTPDHGSFARRALGKKWWHYRMAHLTYFDSKSLSSLLEKANLKIVRHFKVHHSLKLSYLLERLKTYFDFTRVIPLRFFPSEKIIRFSLGDSIGVIVSKK